MLHACSRSDVARLADVARFTGTAPDGEAGGELLELTNRIWRTNLVASRYVSDSMVATWLASPVLWGTVPELLTEENQYRLLAWYCCARPLDTGCQLSREPVDIILDRMAREIVAESPFRRLPYTALMMSVYHFRPDVRDAVSLKGEAPGPTLLGWYYSHGVRELAILHHVSEEERAALNAVADEPGFDILSPLCLFALDWLSHPYFDLSSRDGRVRAWQWFTQTAAKTEPIAALYSSADAGSDGIGDAVAGAVAGDRRATARTGAVQESTVIAATFGDRGSAVDRTAQYRVAWRVAEYFDQRGAGQRLLLNNEWFIAEEIFCWSRAPWASLMFQLAGPADAVLNIGILLHATEDPAFRPVRRLTIYFNGYLLWEGLLQDATDGELLVRAPGWQAKPGVNLLQFHTPEPFIPSESGASSDSRSLGAALRRFWIGPGSGSGGDVMPARRPPHGPPGRPLPDDRVLLVLRGDLRSHTGYGKEARALAKLIPTNFRTVGVDIHPDPADNQAPVAFPVLPEAEALRQVLEQPRECVVVHATGADEFTHWPNARNVGWLSWESDVVPYAREWPLRIGLMDAVWAKTTFMAEFVRRAGYSGPLHPVPWPHEFSLGRSHLSTGTAEVPTHYFEKLGESRRPYQPRLLRDLRGTARLMFLAVQSLAPRKGLPLLLSEWRAHIEQSGGDDILVLRLAFRHASGLSDDWQEVFLDALLAAGYRYGHPVRIALIPLAVSEDALSGLYRTVDAFVSMSYGEGFGGPIVEALEHECPVIAPRHTGLRDLIPADYPLVIASTQLAVALKGNLPAYPNSATWYIPNPGELRSKIEAFAAMSPALRRALVEKATKHARGFCWAPVVRQKLDAALADLRLEAPGRFRERLPTTVLSVHASGHAAD